MGLLDWAGENPGEAVGLASRIGAAWSKDKNATRNVNQAYNTSLADVERTELRGVVQALNKLPGDIFKDPQKMSMALHGIHQEFKGVNPEAFQKVVQAWQSTKVGMQSLLQNDKLFEPKLTVAQEAAKQAPMQTAISAESVKQAPFQTNAAEISAGLLGDTAQYKVQEAQQAVDINKQKLLDYPVDRAKTIEETNYLRRDKGKGATETLSSMKVEAWRKMADGTATTTDLAMIGQGEDKWFRDALNITMQSEEGMKLFRKTPEEGYAIIKRMADIIRRGVRNEGPDIDPLEQKKDDSYMKGFQKWSAPQQ